MNRLVLIALAALLVAVGCSQANSARGAPGEARGNRKRPEEIPHYERGDMPDRLPDHEVLQRIYRSHIDRGVHRSHTALKRAIQWCRCRGNHVFL
jgi:hypothetical protein